MALKAAVFYWNINEKSYIRAYGGERGIRTLDTRLTYTPLARARLQPLGHLSTSPTRAACYFVCLLYDTPVCN